MQLHFRNSKIQYNPNKGLKLLCKIVCFFTFFLHYTTFDIFLKLYECMMKSILETLEKAQSNIMISLNVGMRFLYPLLQKVTYKIIEVKGLCPCRWQCSLFSNRYYHSNGILSIMSFLYPLLQKVTYNLRGRWTVHPVDVNVPWSLL